MKRIFNIITLVTAIFVTSCVKDGNVIKEADYDFKTNYIQLGKWKIITRHNEYYKSK